jgi:origin recognition complex subunit 1
MQALLTTPQRHCNQERCLIFEMPHTTTPLTPRHKRAEKAKRAKRLLAGGTVGRDDSDDELGTEDHPWEWIYEKTKPGAKPTTPKKLRNRKTHTQQKIIGAQMGDFKCMIGDTVLLKAEGSNKAWIGAICDFQEYDGEKSANFLCKKV